MATAADISGAQLTNAIAKAAATPGSYVIAANSNGLPNQDWIVLGASTSSRSPGKATVRGPNRPQGWDVRKGNALSGATAVPTGAELAKFTVLIEIWEATQYAEWKVFAKTYLTRAAVIVGGSPRALAIVHPMVNDPPYSITEVVVEDVVALEEDRDGKYAYEIHFLEYCKPKPAEGKAAAAIPVATAPQPTAQEKVIAANIDKIAVLKGLAPRVPPQ
jgi:hypothetical protein